MQLQRYGKFQLRLLFSEKKSLKSDNIVASLFTASTFELYCFAIIKVLIFNDLHRRRCLFCSKITLIILTAYAIFKANYFSITNIGTKTSLRFTKII